MTLLVYDWSFQVVWDNLPLLLSGLKLTIIFAVIAMALSILGGLILAVAAEFGPLPVRALVLAYTEFFRAFPLLVLLFWLFLALPLVTGWIIAPFTSALLAVVMNYSAFIGEAFRAGMASVGPGQRQAGLALGMRPMQVARRIVWPQGWRITIPIVGSYWVGLFKDSSLVSLVEVHDLMFQARVAANQSFRYLEIFTAAALIYFVVSYPQARLVDWLYARYRTVE